jgi:hypothetical protein
MVKCSEGAATLGDNNFTRRTIRAVSRKRGGVFVPLLVDRLSH